MEKEYRVLSFSEGRELGIYELYSCLVGPDEFECTLMEIEDRTWGRDLRPVVNRLKEQHARIASLDAQLTAAQERNTAEKKRREYYQHIVYSVCNMLDQIDGRHHCIVCGTAEEPCNNVEAKIQQLTTELDSLRQQLAAAQERNTKLQSEHLDHVSALHKRIKELEKKNDHK